MITEFVTALRERDLYLDSKEVADVVWLAAKIAARTRAAGTAEELADFEPADEKPRTEPGGESDLAVAKTTTHGSEPGGADELHPAPKDVPPEPSRDQLSESGEGQIGLYRRSAGTAQAEDTETALALRVAAAASIPEPRKLVRALRPLMVRVPSAVHSAVDEEATVHHYAETRIMVPVMAPIPERWLDLVLVVDGARSMRIWEQAVQELEPVLGQQGAFRNSQLWTLDTEAAKPVLYRGRRKPGVQAHSVREIVDPANDRLIAVVSDCVAPVWDDGRMGRILQVWGRSDLVVVLQVLPNRDSLWERTGLGSALPVNLSQLRRGGNNGRIQARPASAYWHDRPVAGPSVPVVPLDEESFARAAALFAAHPKARCLGYNIPVRVSGEAQRSPLFGGETLSALARLRRFQANASATAQKLAHYLAAAPLNLPIMRLVRKTMLPEADDGHLAEVLLGALLHEQDEAPPQDPVAVSYEFHDGVRELLLEGLPVPATVTVLDAISKYLARHHGSTLDFRAALLDPDAVPREVSEAERPFARLQAWVLRRLGGVYARLAERLAKPSWEQKKDPERGVPTMTYHDFEIELDRCCCDQPEIRVLRSTFDRPRAPFKLDDRRREALEKKVAEFDDLLLRRFADLDDDDDAARRRKELAESIGVELFDLLLPGDIGRACKRSVDALRGRDGLRLRLSFGHEYNHDLGGLPWEMICRPDTRKFIANDQTTPVARYLDLSERIRPLEVVPPLKVLVVIASPDPSTSKFYNYQSIDKPTHRRPLAEAIGSATYLEARFLHELSDSGSSALPEMQRVLQEAETAGSPFHAVHILCHGGFGSDNWGVLFFEREDGSEHLVDARMLAEMLTRDIRLVVLASCSTGRIPIPRRGGNHPFAGVASALVAEGIPAVVAMQFQASEDAAIAFSDAFYHAIDENRPIDVAVTKGRLWIKAKGREGALEWATPVLFLRAFDGQVLNLKTETKPTKKVAIFNVLDEGKDSMKNVDYQVDLRPHFNGRFIRKPEIWNGDLMADLRRTLKTKLPAESPCHLELAAPLSVAFATGFILSAKTRRTITVGQRDQIWRFEDPAPRSAGLWIAEPEARRLLPDDAPLDENSDDLAVVLECSRPAIPKVVDYLRGEERCSPKVGRVLVARTEAFGHFAIENGGHANDLAANLIEQIVAALPAPHSTVHLFLAGPNGLALTIGLQARILPRVQLYEFDFESKRHGSYEPSITLESSMAGV